jgi:glycosyltransferase involved in cell wall biosynthesis
MNILLFNTHNPYREAGAVSLDLFNQLKRKGHNVRLLVNSYDSGYNEGITSVETKFLFDKRIFFEKLNWRLNKVKKALRLHKSKISDPDYHFFQVNERKSVYNTDSLLKKARIRPDIIILLYTKGFVNARNIFEINQKTKAPVFWLLYDMAPFTGGCHYAWECKGYQNSCGNCPGIFSDDPHDITYENLLYKKNYLDKTNIQIITGSEWQDRQVRESTLFKTRTIHKILLSIDSSVFKPLDKKTVRSELGLTTDKKVIFFGAVVLTQKRKGMSYLLESLKLLKEKTEHPDSILKDNILLLIAGNGIDNIADLLPYEFHYMGKTDNTYGIASAYQAADVFLCPSIEDSGPMMINQSLMCGTPVVSFEMGVALDLVKSGKTGYMARLRDSNDMAHGLYNILSLDIKDYKKISEKCRELALELCSPEAQIEKIESIIKIHDS